jgi:Peptidase family C25
MRFFLILYFSLGIFININAQNSAFQNHWIDYSKTYLKIEIIEDGIYKISFDELKKAGLISFKNIGLVHHGKQIAIETQGEQNGELIDTGYIQFYAEKNKGDLDTLVYGSNEIRTNPYHSLFSDVSAYFLTNFQEKPKRITSVTLTQTGEKNTFKEELVFAPNSQYSFNNSIGLLPTVMQSYYETGEGWTGKYISSDSTANVLYTLKDIVPNSKILLDLKLNGRSLTYHSLNLEINQKPTLDALEFEPFGVKLKSYAIDNQNNDRINLKFIPKTSQKYDWYSITFARFNYDRKLDKNIVDRSYRTDNVIYGLPILPYVTYDISDIQNPIKLNAASEGFLNYEKNKALIFTSSLPKKPTNLQLIQFKKLPENPNFLIITDQLLESSANTYASYRNSDKGGKYNTAVVFTSDIYNQFFYGEKSPMAIYNYLKYSVKDREKSFLLLIGKATTFPDVLKSSADMVPSFGYPASDLMLSSGPDYLKNADWIPTGRISAGSNTEVLNYLDKVKEHEANLVTDWQTKGLHLSGGQNPFELFVLKNILENLSTSLAAQDVYSNLKTYNKPTDSPVVQVDISEEINKGVGFLTFVGHGSTAELDYNIGFCSDPKRNITNKGKYPFMFFNGCGVGNVFYKYNVLSSDWLLTPNKGAIAVLANSYWSFANSTQQYLNALYNTMFENPTTVGKSIGESQILALNLLKNNISDPFVRSGIHQVLLQGDPAIKILPFEKPDFTIPENGIFITSANGINSISTSDSIQIGVMMDNLGNFNTNQKYAITYKINWDNGTENNLSKDFKSFWRRDTTYFKVKKAGAIRSIKAEIDIENKVIEYLETNNLQVFTIADNWQKIGNSAIYPESSIADKLPPSLSVTFDGRYIKDKAIVASNANLVIALTDERTIDASKTELIEVFLSACSKCVLEKLEPSKFKIGLLNGNILVYNLAELNLPAGTYSLLIKAHDNANNSPGKVYEKQFIILEKAEKTQFNLLPNPTLGDIQAILDIRTIKNPKSGNVQLLDLKGKQIEMFKFEPKTGENMIVFPRKNKPAGIYFLKFEIIKNDNSKENLVQKVVLI